MVFQTASLRLAHDLRSADLQVRIMLILFLTARILRAHDHEARWKRAVRKTMSGPGGPRSEEKMRHGVARSQQ